LGVKCASDLRRYWMGYEDSSEKHLSSLFPQLKEDLGLSFLRDELEMLGVNTVVSEFEGYQGITFQVFDKDLRMEHIKMDWFPTKVKCPRRHSWYGKVSLFKVGIYVLELPKLDENYSEVDADNEFFTHLEVDGESARQILADALNFISEKYGLDLAVYPSAH
jgi:hypothetical protein